jgi:hypothetical protein
MNEIRLGSILIWTILFSDICIPLGITASFDGNQALPFEKPRRAISNSPRIV